MSRLRKIQLSLMQIEQELTPYAQLRLDERKLEFSAGSLKLTFWLAGMDFDFSAHEREAIICEDQLIREPEKIAAMLRSRLQLNATVFARQCDIRKLDKATAEQFLKTYHIMGDTQSAYNLGLFYREELVAAASFSKGRKMDRLASDKRSFELIRFCCKAGITVTGGLTRLLKHFCREKQAGDIMTYVDKQWSDGRSFVVAGFKKLGESAPNFFLVNRQSFERIPVKDPGVTFDPDHFYLSRNAGNLKLIYTPS